MCASVPSRFPVGGEGETRAVSINGRPLAITSMRRLSMRSTDGRLRSERRVLGVARAPASRHTRAAARSRGQPLGGWEAEPMEHEEPE